MRRGNRCRESAGRLRREPDGRYRPRLYRCCNITCDIRIPRLSRRTARKYAWSPGNRDQISGGLRIQRTYIRLPGRRNNNPDGSLPDGYSERKARADSVCRGRADFPGKEFLSGQGLSAKHDCSGEHTDPAPICGISEKHPGPAAAVLRDQQYR